MAPWLVFFILGAAGMLGVKCSTFDYFIFAQHWPQSVCIKHKRDCKIDQQVNTWTIHGLWPNKRNSSGPIFCPGTKFHKEEVKSLLPRLLQYWPNLFMDDPLYTLWSREWKKHGTCAMTEKMFNTELKYFTAALDLNRMPQYDVFNLLRKNGITPDDTKLYSWFSLHKAIGPHARLFCEKVNNKHFLSQVRICISKDLKSQVPCKGSSHATNRTNPDQIISDNVVKNNVLCLDQNPKSDRIPGAEECPRKKGIVLPVIHHG